MSSFNNETCQPVEPSS